MSKILWFDNDPGLLRPYADGLRQAGHTVTPVTTIADTQEAIRADNFDLLILDVMIPTKTGEEEAEYPPSETDFGHKTGLVLYRKQREHLKSVGTRVLVLTVRLDSGIVAEFMDAGLHKDNFTTKVTLREARDFMAKINEVLGRDA
jgi:CheY-like chemotaxis protein